MREKNRKPIASYIKLPQFTTMNVIDGQAGVIIYSSLICYSLTIDNILNIIVLLILAGVTIVTLTGDNGLLQKAQTAKEQNEEAKDLELIKLAVSAAKVEGKGIITKENLNNELNKNFNTDKTVIERSNYYIYKTDKSYIIYKDGKVEEGILLPDEYQQVEYIESTGTQYIDTGLKPNQDTSLEITLEPIDYYSFSGLKIICGARKNVVNSGFPNYAFFYSKNYETTFITYGSTQNDHVQFSVPRGKHTIKNNKNLIYLDDELKVTYNEVKFLINASLLVFTGRDTSGNVDSRFSAYKLYNFIIYDDDIIAKNFIPCYSTTTVTNVDGVQVPANTKGLYDTVEGKFYTNQGTGEFIAGPEV